MFYIISWFSSTDNSILFKVGQWLVWNQHRIGETNYAPVYSAKEYIYGIFKPVYEHLGYVWEYFLTFARTEHCEQMQIMHLETDDAKRDIVWDFLSGLLSS